MQNETDGVSLSFHEISVCEFDKLTFFDSAKCKSATTGKVKNPHDQFATDIFRSGRATKPKNPYFVTKIRPDRRNHLVIINLLF